MSHSNMTGPPLTQLNWSKLGVRVISSPFGWKELWPPSSPDLNPMGFGIWSILEQKACTVSHPSVEVLKQKLTKSWDEVDAETVCATCAQVVPRLRHVIRERGGYFD